MKAHIKRVYEKAGAEDGYRILIDRLWPRGLTKEKAAADLWLKEIAPTTELRKWFNHEPEKWPDFQKKYLKEIKENKEALTTLREKMKEGKVTLIYGAKDEEHNDAQVLIDHNSDNFFEKCVVLDIFMKMKLEKDARAQIFFIPIDEFEFTEKNSNLIKIKSKDQILQTVIFRIESKKGFSGKFRFDPVDNIQKFTLDKIQGRCRITAG